MVVADVQSSVVDEAGAFYLDKEILPLSDIYRTPICPTARFLCGRVRNDVAAA